MEISYSDRSFYPVDLASMLLHRWQEAGLDRSALPSETTLRALIDTAYQASLLREESDPIQCRILLANPDDPELTGLQCPDGLWVIPYKEGSEYSPHQIRKMAAAAGYYRSLVGVKVGPSNSDPATIWGMIVTGTGWINQTEGTAYDSSKMPKRLVIHILGPGHLLFAAGTARVLETIGGRVLVESFDPFRSKWLPRHFEPFRSKLLDQLDLSSLSTVSVKLCDSFVRDVAQNVVRRVLSLVRNRGHGGMLIFLSDEGDSRLSNWLRIRTRFTEDDATNRFQQLMVRLMQRALEVGAVQGITEVRWRDFQQMRDISLGRLHESLVEFSHFLADLMSVDGCLVLSREFRIIGFGGEILGDSHVNVIERAIDLEAQESISEAADATGTRHRSAYRLICSVPDAIAVVVSQDGAIRFVAHQGGRLVYWPYLP